MRLLPHDDVFFTDLNRLAETVAVASATLVDMLGDLDPEGTLGRRIKDLEHEGDKAVRGILDRLDRTFVTPLDREDLHDLARALDGVLNRIDRIAHRLRLYHVTTARPAALTLGGLVRKSADLLVPAVQALGSKGRYDEAVKICGQVDSLEAEGDRAADAALAELFLGATDPVEIIKWKDLVEDLEKATDKCKTVAEVLRRIVIKNA